MERAGWIDYSTPRPQFDRPHSSWIGSLPEGDAGDYWVRFTVIEPTGQQLGLKLSDCTPSELLPTGRRQLCVDHELNRVLQERVQIVLDAEKFAQGAPVADCVLWPDGQPVESQAGTVYQFVQGLPRESQYFSSRIRYVKTKLRTDAFRCHVGYGYVTLKQGAQSVRYVRDVWYCDDIPFGTLQFEERVLTNGQETSRRLWKVEAASPIAAAASGL